MAFLNASESLDVVQAVSQNETQEYDDRKELYSYIIPVYIGLCLASGIVSSTVVLAIPWVKRPISPTVRLSLSLAAANTVFCFIFTLDLLLMYLRKVRNIEFPVCAHLVLETVRLWIILVQIFHLLALALNHYIGILKPLHYAATITPQVLKCIIAILWLIPLIGMFVGFSVVPNQGYQSKDCMKNDFYHTGLTFRIIWTCIFFGPTFVIIVVYSHIFCLLKNREFYLVSPEQRNHLRRNIKTVRTTALIVLTFLIGWVPAVLKFILICPNCVFTNVDQTTNVALGAAFNIMFSVKVFTDTFIYAIRLPDIRKALLLMYDRIRCRVIPGRHRRASASNSSMRTTFSRLSLTSPSLHRVRMSWNRGSPGSKSRSRSSSNSPILQNHAKKSQYISPGVSNKSTVDIEVTSFANELRLKTLVEEEPNDHLIEIGIDRV
ncbi:trace amine-associated receptor 4-like [Macrobrachium nipponense]|uniref:trace amine-associated receptor 4-like n=1 Tax=Macrobrachium nipponense TaxID=159736 RepID=UPI0030C7AE45